MNCYDLRGWCKWLYGECFQLTLAFCLQSKRPLDAGGIANYVELRKAFRLHPKARHFFAWDFYFTNTYILKEVVIILISFNKCSQILLPPCKDQIYPKTLLTFVNPPIHPFRNPHIHPSRNPHVHPSRNGRNGCKIVFVTLVPGNMIFYVCRGI